MNIDSNFLKEVEKQETEARNFGFSWDSFSQLIEQIQSETTEIQEAFEKGDQVHLQEEIGDLIHAAIALAVFCKFDPQTTLKNAVEKFQRRFDAIVAFATEDGYHSLHDHSLDQLMEYWKRAKKKVG